MPRCCQSRHSSEAGSVSISVEYARNVVTKCPEIKPPPFKSKEVDQASSSSASFVASASPRSGDGPQANPTCSLSTPVLDGDVPAKTVATSLPRLDGAASAPSLSALSSFEKNGSDDINSRFTGVQQETWGWGRRVSTAKERWAGFTPPPTATANVFHAGGTPKVSANHESRVRLGEPRRRLGPSAVSCRAESGREIRRDRF